MQLQFHITVRARANPEEYKGLCSKFEATRTNFDDKTFTQLYFL